MAKGKSGPKTAISASGGAFDAASREQADVVLL